MSQNANPMLTPRIAKVTVNIGVGEGGARLQLAERVLELLTGMTSIRTISKSTNRDLGTRLGAPIGCKVTMRNKEQMNQLSFSDKITENEITGQNVVNFFSDFKIFVKLFLSTLSIFFFLFL